MCFFIALFYAFRIISRNLKVENLKLWLGKFKSKVLWARKICLYSIEKKGKNENCDSWRKALHWVIKSMNFFLLSIIPTLAQHQQKPKLEAFIIFQLTIFGPFLLRNHYPSKRKPNYYKTSFWIIMQAFGLLITKQICLWCQENAISFKVKLDGLSSRVGARNGGIYDQLITQNLFLFIFYFSSHHLLRIFSFLVDINCSLKRTVQHIARLMISEKYVISKRIIYVNSSFAEISYATLCLLSFFPP